MALKLSTARNCLIVNQFATPGLGSLMARRYVAGAIQLLLAVAGFLMVVGWFIEKMIVVWRMVQDQPPQPDWFPGLGEIGALVFFASWLLAWPTTISVMREARKNAPPPTLPERPIPPRL